MLLQIVNPHGATWGAWGYGEGRADTIASKEERLSDKNREALSLYYVQDLSYAEIAAFLGVTEATVLVGSSGDEPNCERK